MTNAGESYSSAGPLNSIIEVTKAMRVVAEIVDDEYMPWVQAEIDSWEEQYQKYSNSSSYN